MERISRMEKAFYPRNDTVNAVVSNLLPRDPAQDIILKDQHDEPVYLQRSSILDGTSVRGFGYVNSKPYKWNLEIETAVKSIAVVPDRFFSIYGKSYPIKRQQTVGINQPSELFKYEIVYLRGYDMYDDAPPVARIIYHAQAEGWPRTDAHCAGDAEALDMLDNFNDYPYLKIRVCWDGSIRAYLGTENVDWNLERQIEDEHANPDVAWVEIPQINTDQFRHIDLWVRFDSINALSYYIITKYENNIFNISPKNIENGLNRVPFWKVPAGLYELTDVSEALWGSTSAAGSPAAIIAQSLTPEDIENMQKDAEDKIYFSIPEAVYVPYTDDCSTAEKAIYYALLIQNQCASVHDGKLTIDGGTIVSDDEFFNGATHGLATAYGSYRFKGESSSSFYTIPGRIYLPLLTRTADTPVAFGSFTLVHKDGKEVKQLEGYAQDKQVSEAVGLDYNLVDPEWTKDTSGCTPCCKKDNLSRSIWAYVNPKTMTPYDDDYWFHQGEPYYKKSLTLSTKENPLKAQKIFVEEGVFPGMYKIVAETLIRERETGEDQRVQITLPLCKIKSDHTLTLQADGDPTTFNLDVEVATPQNGIPMEITFYEVEKEMKTGCSGTQVPKDGSTKISAK